jgi:hypothetical protein
MESPMTSNDQSHPAGPAPDEVPAERPASLDALDVLVGEWDTQLRFPGDPPVTGHGRTTFEWLEGRFFLIQRVSTGQPEGPGAITITGPGPGGTFLQNFFDNRGVQRVYQMSLDGGSWRLWRESLGFWQRFLGTLSPDGQVITGSWEKSPDGASWQHDFDLIYTKTR